MNPDRTLPMARGPVREISPADAEQLIAQGAVLLDTREQHEWNAGYLAGATLLPPAEVIQRVEEIAPDKNRPVVIYCAAGARSMRAALQLASLGYTDVSSMAGGIGIWKAQGRPTQLPESTPSVATNPRYARHMVMPEVGPEGQAKLLQSKVLFIGAGGLGSPGLLYLAAAGVGTLGIVDFDVVDLSNLQRQVVHAEDRIGMKKTQSAAQTIRGVKPRSEGRRPRRDADRRERRSADCRLRRDHRWHGHVRDALHAERRGRPRGNSRGARLGLPVRGPVERVRALPGTVLSLPLSHATAARAGTRLLRRRACSASCPA